MGKRTPSWKQNAGDSNSQQDKNDEIQRREEAASKQMQLVVMVLAVAVCCAAAWWNYAFAAAAVTNVAKGKSQVEGVTQNKHGFTELHKAAEKGLDALKSLFPEHLKALNVTDKWNEAPIHKAAKTGKLSAVKFLLQQGADPNLVSDGESASPLFHAFFTAPNGNIDTAHVLVKGGADVNYTLARANCQGCSLLHVACGALTEFGADHKAAAILLGYGIDTARKDATHGRTALHWAVTQKPREETRAEEEVSSEQTEDDEGEPRGPGGQAGQQAPVAGHLQLIHTLIKAGVNLNAQDQEGFTPLHEAVIAENTDVVKFLLEAGADASIASAMLQRTPLVTAQKKDFSEIVTLLEGPTIAHTAKSK